MSRTNIIGQEIENNGRRRLLTIHKSCLVEIQTINFKLVARGAFKSSRRYSENIIMKTKLQISHGIL